MKYVARVMFKIKNKKTTFYEEGKIYNLYENEGISCVYRYKNDNFEFVLGNFNDKEQAFEKGKILYASLLFMLQQISGLEFELKVLDFNGSITLDKYKHYHCLIDGNEPEKYYYCNHDYYNNYYGLEIFEICEDFFQEYTDLDNMFLVAEDYFYSDASFGFNNMNKCLIEYSDETRNIFSIFSIYNRESNYYVKVLLISIIFEYLSNIEFEQIKNKYFNNYCADRNDKQYILKLLDSSNQSNVCKKCKLLIDKYIKDCKTQKKIFVKFYNIRSSIIHGNIVNEDSETLNKAYLLVLKIINNKYNKVQK